MDKSPCKTCTKTILPYNCENKSCPEWRNWIIAKWEEYNKFYEKYRKEIENNVQKV
jgi:uncharacterized protein YeaO (DUF488 family)